MSLDKRRPRLSPLSRRNAEETDTGRTRTGAAEMPSRGCECLFMLTAPASSENRLQSPVRGDFSTCFRTPRKNEPVKENKFLFLYGVLNKSGWCHDTCGAEAKKVCSLIFNSDKVLTNSKRAPQSRYRWFSFY